MGDFLSGLLPTVATALGGPLAGMALKFVGDKLGVTAGTQDSVTAALQNLGMTPEGRVQLAQIDADLKKHFDDNGIKLEELAAQNAGDINKTMQAESGSEHWPTYSWRPAIGFAVALAILISVLVCAIAYIGVMFAHQEPAVLAYLPAMLGSMAALIGVASPILGIASWFRGKMQATGQDTAAKG